MYIMKYYHKIHRTLKIERRNIDRCLFTLPRLQRSSNGPVPVRSKRFVARMFQILTVS
ncbi:hypothetical protein WDU94_000349 [Cyamophila willieti]